MQRSAHHRVDYRSGPHHSWLRRKAYHLAKLFQAVRIGLELIRSLQPLGRGIYRLDALHLMPQARKAFGDAQIYLDDETGDVWS